MSNKIASELVAMQNMVGFRFLVAGRDLRSEYVLEDGIKVSLRNEIPSNEGEISSSVLHRSFINPAVKSQADLDREVEDMELEIKSVIRKLNDDK